MLVRSGIGRIRLIDFDQVTLSSLNRHAVANLEDVGTSKVQCLKKALLAVAPWVNIEIRNTIWELEVAEELLEGNPSYVVDAIDNIDTKVDLLYYCKTNNIPVISSMGAGCKSDPSRVRNPCPSTPLFYSPTYLAIYSKPPFRLPSATSPTRPRTLFPGVLVDVSAPRVLPLAFRPSSPPKSQDLGKQLSNLFRRLNMLPARSMNLLSFRTSASASSPSSVPCPVSLVYALPTTYSPPLPGTLLNTPLGRCAVNYTLKCGQA